MAKNTKTRKKSSKSKKNSSSWSFKSRKTLLIFITLFALVAGYTIYRSFAADVTLLRYGEFVKAESANAVVVVDNTTGSKKGSSVVQLSGGASSKATFQTTATRTISKGIYEVCLISRNTGSVAGGILVSNSTKLIGGTVYNISASSAYAKRACAKNVTIDTSTVKATVTNTGSGQLFIGSVAFTKTANLTTTGDPTKPYGYGATGGPSGTWNLNFKDEFNGSSLDPKYWSKTWFGGSEMNNVKTSANNVSLDGSNLVLTLSSSSLGALVNSNPSDGGKTGYQFGTGYYAEARIMFAGSGNSIYNWPAFWTDGQNWPENGEIDIAEGLGPLTANYHSSSGAKNSGQISGDWGGKWHTYAVERNSGNIRIFWDGVLKKTYTTDDGGAPHYLIFNVGSGRGEAHYGTSSQMKIDYVRVWKR